MEIEKYIELLEERYGTHVKPYIEGCEMEDARWEMENFFSLLDFRRGELKKSLYGIGILVSSNKILDNLREGIYPDSSDMKKLEGILSRDIPKSVNVDSLMSGRNTYHTHWKEKGA